MDNILEEMTVDEMKKKMVNIMKYIDQFCEKNDIEYYLAYGTLIGAIRHKGFIPWDDDIDIVMPRKSYEKFIELYRKDESKYNIIEPRINGAYYLPFAKVYDSETVLRENISGGIDIGVYVDVFPIDNLGKSYERAKKLINKLRIYYKMLSLKQVKYSSKRKWYGNMMAKIFSIVPISSQKIVASLMKKALKYYKLEDNRYAGMVVYPIYGQKEILPAEWYSNAIRAEFEGEYFNVPKEYDNILKQIYGDYMELPPIEQRVTHHSYKVWKKL